MRPLALVRILDATVDHCEQRVIRANADVLAGMPLRAALTHDDVAGETVLAAETASRRGACPPSRGRYARIRLLSCEPWLKSVFVLYHNSKSVTKSSPFVTCRFFVLAPSGLGLAGFLAAAPWPWSAAVFSPPSRPASASASAAASGRPGRRLGFLDPRRRRLDGFAPSVRISVIRTRVNSWRWPRLRREFLRRRFLKAMTFGAATLLEHLAGDRGARHRRAAEDGRLAADHQHLAEFDDLAGLGPRSSRP